MKQRIINAFTVLLFILFSNAGALQAQVLEEEGFENSSFPPPGWLIINGNFLGGIPANTGAKACKNSQLISLLGLGRATLVSKPFDLRARGSSPSSVSFSHINTSLLTLGLQKINVYVNTIPSLTGAQFLGYAQPSSQYNEDSFNIPASYKGSSNYVIFETTTPLTALSPGVSMDDVAIDTYPVLDVAVKIMLEGAFIDSYMSNMLTASGSVPYANPYNTAPFNYNGSEQVSSSFLESHPGIIDWVMIELRADSLAESSVGKRALFLKDDGTLIDTSGGAYARFTNIREGSYYIVVYHRNHLIVMSSVPVPMGSYTDAIYDFTTGVEQYYGLSGKNLGNGIFGMYAGNAIWDGTIDSLDTYSVDDNQSVTGYYRPDINLDGVVDAEDYRLIEGNKGKVVVVPYILN